MRSSLFLLAVLILTANAGTVLNSLCITCTTMFSSMCLTCAPNGCSPYSTLNTNTGIFLAIQVNAAAILDTISIMTTPVRFSVVAALSAVPPVLDHKPIAALHALTTSPSILIHLVACRLLLLRILPSSRPITFWGSMPILIGRLLVSLHVRKQLCLV